MYRSSMVRFIGMILSLVVGLQTANADIQPNDPKAPVRGDQSILDRLGQWGITGDIRLIGLEFFGNSYVRAGYRYGVEPAFNEGLFSRLDRYYFEANIEPVHEIRQAVDEDFGFSVSAKNRIEVDFIRHYEESEPAVKAKPYFAKNLPIDSERAVNNLNPSDLVLMKSRLGIMVKGRFFHEMGSAVGFEAEAWYLVAGEFQVHVLRLNDGQLRVKFLGIRNEEKGFEAGVSVLSELKVFKIRRVDEKVTEILDLNPIVLKLTGSNNGLFLVDYHLDMKNEDTRRVYDTVMARATKFTDGSMVDPRKSIEEIRDALIVDLAQLEDIANEDRNRRDPRVSRNFKGSGYSKYRGSELKLGVRFLKTKDTRKHSENRIISIGENSQLNHYFLHSYQTINDFSAGFSYARIKRETDLNALYRTDANFQNRRLDNLIFNSDRFDKKFSQNDYQSFKNQLRRNVKREVYTRIPFDTWFSRSTKDLSNVTVGYQITLLPTFFNQLPNRDARSLAQDYIRYLETVPMSGIQGRRDNRVNLGTGSPLEQIYGYDVQSISRRLTEVFTVGVSAEKKAAAIMELRSRPLFRETGIGFMSSYVPAPVLANFLRLDISFESSEKDDSRFEFGNFLESPVYRRVLYVQRILNKDRLDIRLESEGERMRDIRRGRP